jgi:ribosomal protein S1
MRNRFTMAVLTVLVLVGLVATLSMAAGPKQYQWTGTVTEVDAKAKTITVDKGTEGTWEFSTEGLKDPKVKKGDKVTVYYVAIAKKIEAK